MLPRRRELPRRRPLPSPRPGIGAFPALFILLFILSQALVVFWGDNQVINTLGMSKEEVAEVRNTFDAELLALSRLNTPHIVKVKAALREGLCESENRRCLSL